MATAEQLSEVFARLQVIEGFANSNRLLNDRTIGKAIIGIEAYVKTRVDDPQIQASGLRTSMNSELGTIMDEKIKTAMNMSKGGIRGTDLWWESILQSKAVQEIGPVVDAKQYRQWNKKMKNAPEQAQPNARQALEFVE